MTFYKKLMLVAASAVLSASFAQQAGAWGGGGSTSTSYKLGLAGLTLVCNMSDPNIPSDQAVQILSAPSNLDRTASPSLTFGGEMYCAEKNSGGYVTPTGADSPWGLFKLTQVTPGAFFPGLIYTQNLDSSGNGTRTWTFDVSGHTASFPYAQALWSLTPVDNNAQQFCNPNNFPGVTGAPPVLKQNACEALFGVRTVLPLLKADYQGVTDSTGSTINGAVFRFQTVTTTDPTTQSQVESAASFQWAPCHTTRFIGPLSADVDAANNSSDVTKSGAINGTPLPLTIPYQTSYMGSYDLYLSFQPNDLWNSGVLPQWSNANGLWENIDISSYIPNYLGELDPDVSSWCDAYPTYCTGGVSNLSLIGQAATPISSDYITALQGALVSQIGNDTSTYQEIATDYSRINTTYGSTYGINATNYIPAVTQGATLNLFYWDTAPKHHEAPNYGKVNVSVATDEVQCSVNSTSINTSSSVRPDEEVTVIYNPTLNVGSPSVTANFPVTIPGGCDYQPPFTIGSDGSPIISYNDQGQDDTVAYINGTPVTYNGFHVADTTSCTGGSADGNADLRIDLQQSSVIGAIAPGGICTNGTYNYKLEIGSGHHGWYAGTSQVTLTNCSGS